MTKQSFVLIERLPSVSEHKALWEAVGWGDVHTEMTSLSLASSIYGVVVEYDDEVIGMGRVVGDGAMYHYVQDVAVSPLYQGRGLGKLIIEKLMQYIDSRSVGPAFVGLFASHGKEAFYEQYGFANHAPNMTGMFKVVAK
ncbi:GNAT superfamily N-acetyltransferase [Paenibacillus castaneae]|uniref:GNAT family N-acetyltransferase n=1 Tax=Paenibacillus castaneae TaxID=474957 RepID=UPI000C9B2B4E|nr:GNAT family N-acetyltransferase [Paenibacillus castaneae]NIK75924.1 GNAT superfamily N-acetyltransferase [Paenibacillus castaneae]